MGHYRTDEIKYNIDHAIQLAMLENDKEVWNVILEVQTKLYDAFGIEE